jgi:hypothetical protein
MPAGVGGIRIAPSAPAGVAVLGVDGLPTGCAALWSHWPHAPLPPVELADDTATGMAVRAALDPERWLAPWTLAIDDHADADGCLALAACRDPGTAYQHSGLLRAAAECSDFQHHTTAAALRLALLVNRILAGCDNDAARTAAACRVADGLGDLCRLALDGDADLDRSVRAVEDAIERLHARHAVDWWRQGGLLVIRWQGDGRGADPFAAPAIGPGIGPHALTAFAPDLPQLLIVDGADGPRLWLDAPRYAWARTVRRPSWSAPDLGRLVAELADEDPQAGWCGGEAARRHGFSCLAAAPRPVRLDPGAVAARIAAALDDPGPTVRPR